MLLKLIQNTPGQKIRFSLSRSEANSIGRLKKIVAVTAITIPQAAEVPIAFLMSCPSDFRYGTVKVPPPIPKGIDRKPIIEPGK